MKSPILLIWLVQFFFFFSAMLACTGERMLSDSIVLSGESRDDASYRLPRLKSDRLAAFRKALRI